ncbi:hypothetical protein [Portibacter lacus]|uniref:Uncharacterized protein n=1 Tax=Portibacter lacus TaxID=1099794 RepID=A0AA37SMU0_9BACT|nr:hypothetical protein [Portibacter lacus]GLR17663.1 hypothetical protein GCM10007940_22780 [Portibacter lacus]
MKIRSNMTTEEVKNTFHNHYPMLKIEFYNKEHGNNEISSNKNLITEEVTLDYLNPDLNDGELSLNENIKVSDFEKLMEDYFGLYVQVFRKSGDQWLQTSITDSWTLGKQEAKGESLDKFLNAQKE